MKPDEVAELLRDLEEGYRRRRCNYCNGNIRYCDTCPSGCRSKQARTVLAQLNAAPAEKRRDEKLRDMGILPRPLLSEIAKEQSGAAPSMAGGGGDGIEASDVWPSAAPDSGEGMPEFDVLLSYLRNPANRGEQLRSETTLRSLISSYAPSLREQNTALRALLAEKQAEILRLRSNVEREGYL